MSEHPTVDSLKYFIVVGAPFKQKNDGSLFSNALFIRDYALQVLHLPEESVKIYSPMDFDTMVNTTGAPYHRFRFLNDTYTKLFTNIDFIHFSNFDFLDEIKKQIDKSTDAFLFFFDHGEIGSFGNAYNIDFPEIYQFLIGMEAHSKRIYMHSCFSGGLVEIAQICDKISPNFCKSIKDSIDSLHPLAKKLVDQPIEVYRIYQMASYLINNEKTIFDVLQSYNLKTSLQEAAGTLAMDLEAIHKIFSEIETNEPSLKEAQKTYHIYLEFDHIPSNFVNKTNVSEILAEVYYSKPFVSAAIHTDEKEEMDVTNFLRIAQLFLKMSEKNEFDYEAAAFIFSAFSSTINSFSNFIEDLKNLYRVIDKFNSEIKSSVPPTVFAMFCKLLISLKEKDKLDTKLKLTNTKILTSSQYDTESLTYPEYFGMANANKFDITFQNDPVTCEYIRAALLEPSPVGINLKRIVDQIRLMHLSAFTLTNQLTFQIPQYFQTDDVTNDSLYPILCEHNIPPIAEACIAAAGFLQSKTPYSRYTMNLPSFEFTLLPYDKNSSPRPYNKYIRSNFHLHTIATKTSIGEDYIVEGVIPDSHFKPLPGQAIRISETRSIHWRNLPIIDKKGTLPADSEPKTADSEPKPEEKPSQQNKAKVIPNSNSFFSQDFYNELSDLSEEEEYSDVWFDPLFLHRDDPMPTEADDLYDLRHLKVGPNLKCGLRNFDVYDVIKNRKWVLSYNTIRLFFYHLERKLGVRYDNIFTLDPVPKGDRPYLTFEAKMLFYASGPLNGTNEYNHLFYRSINRAFHENKEKNDVLREVYKEAFSDATTFLDNHYKDVMQPLTNWRNAQSAYSLITVALNHRREQKRERIMAKKRARLGSL